MKVIKFAAVFLMMVVSLMSVSCTSSVEPIDPAVLNPNIDLNTPVAGAFKVDFNDQTFTSTTAGAVITGTKITIAALNSTTGENFTINLTGITTGEYSTTDKVSVLYKEAVSDSFGFLSQITIGSTATVKVTSINNATKRIKGTFKFIGNWNDPTNATPPAAIQFLNGTFDLPFTTTVVPVDVASFTVDIDGVQFLANTIEAKKTALKDAITNDPIIDPNTGLPIYIYSIRSVSNQTKVVSITFYESTDNLHNIPSDGTSVNYIPDPLNPLVSFSAIDVADENIGNITITSNDMINKIISGTFVCKVSILDFTTGEISSSKQLTSGVFTNVTYTIE